MKRGRLEREGRVLLGSVQLTESAWERTRGLLFRPEGAARDGFLINHCHSVHSFFMLYAIDLVYLSSKYEVVKTVKKVLPWRMSYCSAAAMVLELGAGMIEDLNIELGDRLLWYEV